MIDYEKILSARKNGDFYLGDLERDTNDALEFADIEIVKANAIRDNVSEIISQFPDEDFLQDVIDYITDCVPPSSKINKSEMIGKFVYIQRKLERIQQDQNSATEYAFSLNKLRDVTTGL